MSKQFDFTKVERAYRTILSNLPLSYESVSRTPFRATKALAELTKGYYEEICDIIGQGIFPHEGSGIIQVRGLRFYSICEHHLLPFTGSLSISYIPNGQILGLSKFKRITEMFSRRLQTQERLTEQIADAIETGIKAKGVLVVIKSTHLCMVMRGVNDVNSETLTVAKRGEFIYNEALMLKCLTETETKPKI